MNQLSLIDGLNMKDEGISRVTSNAGNFVRLMREVAIRISQERGSVSTDDLRVYAYKYGMKPHHPNAWGGIMRGKGWVVVGHKQSEWASNHARTVTVWRWEP